nr:hypothetical protein [uncultured Niameybacter sp.]
MNNQLQENKKNPSMRVTQKVWVKAYNSKFFQVGMSALAVIISLVTVYVLLDIKALNVQIIIGHIPTFGIIGIISGLATFQAVENYNIYQYIKNFYQDTVTSDERRAVKSMLEEVQATLKSNPRAKINAQTYVEAYISNQQYKGKTLLEAIKGVKTISPILIILGVLGTFIGLVLGLKSFATGDMSKIVEGIPHFLQGVNTAFYTSIAGIIFSLILQGLCNKFNCETIMVQWMLKLELLLGGKLRDDDKQQMLQTFESMKNTMVHMDKQLSHLDHLEDLVGGQNTTKVQLAKVIDGIGKVNKGLSALTALESAAEGLNEFNKGFKQNIDQFSQIFEGALGLMEGFAKQVSGLSNYFQQLQKDMENQYEMNVGIKNYVQTTYQQLELVTNSLERQQQQQSNTYGEMIHTLTTMEQQLGQNLAQANMKAEEKREQIEKIMGQFQMFMEQTKQQMNTLLITEDERSHQRQVQLESLLAQIETFMERQYAQQEMTQQVMSSQMKKAFTAMSEQLQALLAQFEGNIDALQGPFQSFVEQVSDQMEALDSQLVTQLQGYQSFLGQMIDNQEELCEVQKASLAHTLEEHGLLLGEHEQVMKEMESLTYTLRNTLQEMDSKMISRFENSLHKFNEYVATMNKVLERKINVIQNEQLVEQLVKAVDRSAR